MALPSVICNPPDKLINKTYKMPKSSEKWILCENLASECLLEILSCQEQDEDNLLEEYLEKLLIVLSFRYTVPFLKGNVMKSNDWRCTVLPNLDEDRFKSLLRVNFTQFNIILNLIKDDSVFISKHSSKQMSVELQLAIVLYRLGCSGEGGTIRKIANLFGCGDGGTISIVTKRVFAAILNKKDTLIFWPRQNERNQIISSTFHELPHCIGYIDGTEIPLAEKPSCDPDSYYSRKQQFSIKAQIVCDYKLRVRHLICGFPGSVHDQRMFNYSALATNTPDLFSGMQWIAGDTAYTLTTSVLTPFKTPAHGSLTPRQKKFNAYFSKYRVRVEHTFGILKEKFSSLKQLKIKISNKESIKFACAWFTVCCILHNILRPTEEFQEVINEIELFDDNFEEEEDQIEAVVDRNAIVKRNALFEIFV